MSCKYCKPLESTGRTEPLLALGDNCTCRIEGNRLTLKCYGASTARTIDRCPICGQDLTPFGSTLFDRYD